MPSGSNAVKGQQGFQPVQRTAPDLDGVQIEIPPSPAQVAHKQASERFQAARSELSAAAEAYLADEVRSEHPDALSFTIASDWTDEGRERIFFLHATTADGADHPMSDMDMAEDLMAEDYVWHGEFATIDLGEAS